MEWKVLRRHSVLHDCCICHELASHVYHMTTTHTDLSVTSVSSDLSSGVHNLFKMRNTQRTIQNSSTTCHQVSHCLSNDQKWTPRAASPTADLSQAEAQGGGVIVDEEPVNYPCN